MISKADKANLLAALEKRFNKNMHRHEGFIWEKVLEKLIFDESNITTLYRMECTGGEPDVVSYNNQSNEYSFFDCAPESPKERRSTCYDRQAWEERKEHKPQTDAESMAKEIGIEILKEDEYRYLQTLGDFDLKTSSWLKTPPAIRKLGGAIFGDRRYDTVFIYHNGAQSYYGARGFRGRVTV
jgi:hypothetical protein